MTIDLDRQIACVRREVGMRKRVYQRWVGVGKITQEKADDELAAMEAVLATLERLRDGVRPDLF
jgi:hypothetical protein